MSEKESINSKPNFNKVYKSLVESEDDIVGFIAYGLYKKSKQDFIIAFKDKNKEDPTNEDIETHVACSEIPALDNYRRDAKLILDSFLESVVTEKEIELRRFLRRSGRREFFFSSLSGVVGNFMTTCLIILFLFVASTQSAKENFASGAKENIVSGIAKVLGVDLADISP